MVQKTIRQYYLLAALVRAGLGLVAAVYATYLLKHGLNLFEINLVNLVFFVAIFLLEMPTGAFADVYGRKASFVLSCICWGACGLVYSQSTTVWGFIAAELFGALGLTLSSGAFTAWFVDALRYHGYGDPIEPLFARGEQIAAVSGLTGALAGAVMADYYLPLPYVVQGALLLGIAVLAHVSMREDYFERKPASLKECGKLLAGTIRASAAYGLHNANVRFLMVTGFGLYAAVMAANMQWQPHFSAWLPTQSLLGLVWIGMTTALMAGAQCAYPLLRRLGSRKALLVCHITTGAGITVTVLAGAFAPSIAAFMLHELGRGAIRPVHDAYLHKSVPSTERATISSFESLSRHLGGALGLVASGALAHWGSIPLAWVVSGGSLIFMAAVLWRR